MTFHPALGSEKVNLNDGILILPSVSLANLPQLTADLLITSLNLARIGWIGDGSTTVPFIGTGEDGQPVTGGLELYGGSGSNIFVLLQRSPTVKTRKEEHVDLIKSFITSSQFGYTLVLTSLDAANQDDAQLLTPHQRIIPSPSTSSSQHPLQDRLSNLPPLQLHLAEPLSPQPPNGSLSAPSSIYPPFIPGGGLTRRVLGALKDSQVPHGTIGAWCVEGDNREDARALAVQVLQLLDQGNVALREPVSWKGLFGTTEGWSGGLGSDAEIYG